MEDFVTQRYKQRNIHTALESQKDKKMSSWMFSQMIWRILYEVLPLLLPQTGNNEQVRLIQVSC